MPFLWDGVIAVSSPRVTSEQAAHCQVESLERAMFSECLKSILGTSGGKAAARLLERREADLIESDKKDEWKDCSFLDEGAEVFILLFHVRFAR